ncbi:hypothetical protein ANANG_G00113500, partial [Anguilla anguilla]
MMLRMVCSPSCICSSSGLRVLKRPRHWKGRLMLVGAVVHADQAGHLALHLPAEGAPPAQPPQDGVEAGLLAHRLGAQDLGLAHQRQLVARLQREVVRLAVLAELP